MEMAVRPFYGACDLVLSPSPASDEALTRIGLSADGSCAGIAGWTPRASIPRFAATLCAELDGIGRRARRLARPSRVRQPTRSHRRARRFTCSTRGGSPARRGSTCWPTRSWRRTRATSACTWCSRAAGPSTSAWRARLGALRHLPRLAARRRARARLRVRRPLPVLEPDRHLRPGDPRGAGLGRARARGRRRRAADAHRASRDRAALRADAEALADALLELAGSPLLRERLSLAALGAVRERTWERALERLADGYGARCSPGTLNELSSPERRAATDTPSPTLDRAAA